MLLLTTFWSPLLLSFQLALITTCCLLFLGIPVAYFLARTQVRFKFLMEAILALPLVLPPTVIGFYWLLLCAPDTWLGQTLNNYLGLSLLFSFEGLVLASMLYSLPFMVQPLQAAFQQLPSSWTEVAQTMGKGSWEILWHLYLPNSKAALWTGVVLSFAHTVGEFGIVLMIGGKISGETLVASIALYDQVEALQYAQAHQYAAILLASSFVILASTYFFNQRRR